MKKLLIMPLLVIACFVLLTINLKPIAAPIAEAVEQIVVPGPTEILPDPVVLVMEVRQLARLETAIIVLERTIKGTRDNERLAGVFGETIVFVAYGEIVAGIDLSNLKTEDVEVMDHESVKIRLPEPEILGINLDNEKSYVAYRGKGVLARTDAQLETKIRVRAVQALEQNALEIGILETAKMNAEMSIRNLLFELGIKNVEFFQ